MAAINPINPARVSPDRERRAYEWIRTLSELPARFAGTLCEREAAERIGGWMQELGSGEIRFESVPSRPRTGLVIALHTGVGALGCIWGGFPGVLLTVLALWSFRRELRGRQPLLSRLLPTPTSVDVIGSAGAARPSRRVILSAHIDAPQAGWVFSKPVADLFARIATARGERLPVGPLAIPEGLLALGALTTLAAWMGAHGFLLGLLHAFAVGGLLLGVALDLQWAFAVPSPGANDNASAVAAMLTCAERLVGQLPSDTQLLIVGTGAEEVGCEGMHTLVGNHADAWPKESTYFINFECVGGGNLHIIQSEGVLVKGGYPPALLDLARRVAASGQFGAITPTDLLAATDGHVPAQHGYPTLSIISLEDNCVPRNYHRPNDTVEALDMATVVRSADFGAAVAIAALSGEAGPIRVL